MLFREACVGCGAHAVGEPLPRPERELPSFGRSLLLAVTGALTVIVFLTDAVVTFIGKAPSFDLWSLFWTGAAALETAAWHFKWAMIPFSFLVFFGFRKIYRSVKQSPVSFCGLRYARSGYFASAAVPLLVLVLIGVTVPARLEQRDLSADAQTNAYIIRADRAQDEYRAKFGTLPSELKDLHRLPDSDGSLAKALTFVENAEYTPNSEVAAAQTKKPRPLRGSMIVNASVSSPADETLSTGISFTNYEFRLPGLDKLQNTDDDIIVRDGVRYSVADLPRRVAPPVQARQR